MCRFEFWLKVRCGMAWVWRRALLVHLIGTTSASSASRSNLHVDNCIISMEEFQKSESNQSYGMESILLQVVWKWSGIAV
jgi:hypothetical protein